jgi:hypothetical protein
MTVYGHASFLASRKRALTSHECDPTESLQYHLNHRSARLWELPGELPERFGWNHREGGIHRCPRDSPLQCGRASWLLDFARFRDLTG